MLTGSLHRPALRRHLALSMVCAAALSLAACQQSPPPPSNATPEKAIATNLRLAATGDFDGLMQNRLPPADYAVWRHEWDAAHAHPTPISAIQQQQFAEIMQMLTAPGAEAKLLKRVEPTLATLKGNHNTLPIASSIIEAAGRQMIAESPQLGPAQRSLALQGLGALIAWAQATDFSSDSKARKAIALICTTARALHVQTLAQWRALDYAATMKNYGIIWNGLNGLLNLYGLDLAHSLTAAKISTVAHTDPHATVKLDLQLAGQRLTATWPMLEQGDHWYDAAILAAWATAHPAPAATVAAPASAGSAAPAGTNAAPSSSASGTPAVSVSASAARAKPVPAPVASP